MIGLLERIQARTRTLVIATNAAIAAFMGPGLALADEAMLSAEIAELRELENATITLIEKTKPAFCFIAGGSGFLISPDGYVLTNEHVVEGQSVSTVFLAGGRMFRADVVGHDPQGDTALLKLRDVESELPYLEFGDSDALRVGQPVLAIGDPFLIGSENFFLNRVPPDYEPSASTGVVSAVHRYSDTYSDAIQVDLAVNRGNSGGPLVTYDGKVVGINGKIETRFAPGINSGVGYAVPTNQIARFLEPLKKAEGGVVQHGSIIGLEVAERAESAAGLPIIEVLEGSPAEKAGFRKGDLVLRIGGHSPHTATRYRGILLTYPAGEEVTVEVLRGIDSISLPVSLVTSGRAFLGVRTEEVDGGAGVRVTSVVPRSSAARAGIEVDDVILAFADQEVATATDLARLVKGSVVGTRVPVRVMRGGEEKRFEILLGGR